MSFRDLEGNVAVKGGGQHSRHQPPMARRETDSSIEKLIKANIEEMKEHLERARRCAMSKRVSDGPDELLKRSRSLVQQIEQLFRDWTLQLAGEPLERQRKKFSYEKLQKAFEEEVLHLKEIARQAAVAQHDASSTLDRAMDRNLVECYFMSDEQDEERGLLNKNTESCATYKLQCSSDTAIQGWIPLEREECVRRTQGQMSEVHQIFRELGGSITSEQAQQVEAIETHVKASSSNTKQALWESTRAVEQQSPMRERFYCMLVAAIVSLFFVILPYLHSSGFRHHSSGDVGAILFNMSSIRRVAF